ncbi:MAG: hypothetical protein IJ192_08420 [Clostridia bacterium]|nr:hypothetical protein [Clostridia bacterium]
MLRDQPFTNSLLINLLLGAIWHYITFIICVSVNNSFFDPDKKMYHPHKWENGGKFYNDVLKINKWKDFLPQHIGKDGFSKDHLDDTSIPYLDEFIMETCRGEWNHTMNCMFAVILFIINNFFTALILTLCLLAGNLPFAVIQRYNRFRLQKLRNMLIRKAERSRKKAQKLVQNTASANTLAEETTANGV